MESNEYQNKKKWRDLAMNRFILFVVFVAVLTVANIVPVMAAEPIKVTVDDHGYLNFDVAPRLEDDRLLVPMRAIFEALDAQVDRDKTTHTIIGKNLIENSTIKLIIGQKNAYINGKAVELDTPAKIIEGRTLVPLRFVSEALGATVKWHKESNTVHIESDFLRASLDEYRFWIKKTDSELIELFIASGKSAPEKFADLNLPIVYRVGEGITRPTLTAEKTPKGHFLLTVENNYGEPQIHNDVHSIYINLANHTVHTMSSHYSFRFEDNIKSYKEQVVLTNGKQVFLVNDNTGEINQTLDLVNLVGEEDSYLVEGMGENYLLVRPNRSGLLTLINLTTNEKVQLYKELLNETEQEYAETNDVPYKGDWLKFIEQKGNSLYFKNTSTFFRTDNTLYVYELK